MAAIKYTSIINSFVSTEGMNGMLTNYIYYSVLVVYTDGTREIVEGSRDKIAPLLHFLHTPVDEIQDLKQSIARLSSDMNKLNNKIDVKMDYVLDTICPIPDVRGLRVDEALNLINEHGLVPNVIKGKKVENSKGVITFQRRNDLNYKCVDIGIDPIIPSVEGLTKDVAIEALEKSGFQANVTYVKCQEHEDDIVLGYSSVEGMPNVVEVEVGSVEPGLQQSEGINAAGEKAYYPIPIEGSSSVKCPKCNAIQPSGRHICWKCSLPFMY